MVRRQVPVALAPAHGRRVQAGQEGGPVAGGLGRLDVVGEGETRAVAQAYRHGPDVRQGRPGVPQRPARPPLQVGLARGPVGGEPAAHHLGLRLALGHLRQARRGRPGVQAARPRAPRAAAAHVAVRSQESQYAAADALPGRVRLVGRHHEGLLEPGDVRRQLRGRRLAARGEGLEHRPLGRGEPSLVPAGGEGLEQGGPLPLGDGAGGGVLDVRRDLGAHGEDRAPHRQQFHQRHVLVQPPLHLLRRRLGEPRAGGEVDGRRVGGVQPDERVRHGLDGPGPPPGCQEVAVAEAGAAVVVAEGGAGGHGATVGED